MQGLAHIPSSKKTSGADCMLETKDISFTTFFLVLCDSAAKTRGGGFFLLLSKLDFLSCLAAHDISDDSVL